MTVSTSLSKHTVHSPFLLPVGSGAEKAGDTGGLRGELGAVTRDDSDAEDDWLTPKVMSESLSSWEPLKDPDGVMVSELDCRVPGSQTGSSYWGPRCTLTQETQLARHTAAYREEGPERL